LCEVLDDVDVLRQKIDWIRQTVHRAPDLPGGP
jgi:hypothetical protein